MNKTIEKNFIFNILKTITTILFPLITFPYATRVLGVDNIGKVQYCTSIINYFVLIATLGIGIYGVREGSKYKNDIVEFSLFFKELMIINTISMLVAYSLLAIFVFFFFKESYLILLLICSLLILFQSYSIEWLYQVYEDYHYISLRATFINIITLIVMILFVKKPEDYLIYALISVFSVGGSFIFNIINARKYIVLKTNRKLKLKRHIKQIMVIFGVVVASSIYLNLDTVMLGAMVGTTAVGLYVVAVKLQNVVKTIISAIINVLFTRLSNYLGNNMMEQYQKLLDKGIHLIIMITIPASIGLFLVSKQTILLLSGIEYINASFASEVLSLNLFFSVVDGILYYQILLPHGMEKSASKSTIIGALSNIILNFIFIPYFSYKGAALTTLISEIFVFINLYRYSSKCVNLKNIFIYTKKFFILSIPMILWCLVINILVKSIFLNLVLCIMGGTTIYIIMLLIIKDEIVIKELNKIICNYRK